MAEVLFILLVRPVANLPLRIERPVRMNRGLSVMDADELSRRHTVNLPVWREMRFRPQRQETGDVFLIECELRA